MLGPKTIRTALLSMATVAVIGTTVVQAANPVTATQKVAMTINGLENSMSVGTWLGSVPDLKIPATGNGLEMSLIQTTATQAIKLNVSQGSLFLANYGGLTVPPDGSITGVDLTVEPTRAVVGSVSISPQIKVGRNNVSFTNVSPTLNTGLLEKKQMFIGGGLKVGYDVTPTVRYESELGVTPLMWTQASISKPAADAYLSDTTSYFSTSLSANNTLSVKVAPSLQLKASAQLLGIGFINQWEQHKYIASDGTVTKSAIMLPASWKSSWKLYGGLSWSF